MRKADHRPHLGEFIFHRGLETLNALVSRSHTLSDHFDFRFQSLRHDIKVATTLVRTALDEPFQIVVHPGYVTSPMIEARALAID